MDKSSVISSVKALAESISFLPSTYYETLPSNNINGNGNGSLRVVDEEEIIPVIDFSLFTSADPNQRSKVVQDIGKACREWRSFMVINHGFEEREMQKMLDISEQFFNLKEEEKREFEGSKDMDSITYGTSLHNSPTAHVMLWRDFLKVKVHPIFNSPNKPLGFSDAIKEYSGKIREISRVLFEGISESLGLEAKHIEKSMNLDSTFQYFAINYYPPCPQPELAVGLPQHTDHGLMTFVICNGQPGLQFDRDGKWVNMDIPPGAFLVNLADHMQIATNGKYKSCVHRVLVNKTKRVSIALSNGPSLDTVVEPSPKLVDEANPAAYRPMKYVDYVDLQIKVKDRKIQPGVYHDLERKEIYITSSDPLITLLIHAYFSGSCKLAFVMGFTISLYCLSISWLVLFGLVKVPSM